MPIITVQMYPGRSEVVKEFIARGLVDVVAELAGTTREGAQVIFEDVPKDHWAIGPRLSSTAEAREFTEGRAYVTVSRIGIQPDKHAEYLAWRRDSVYPFMASHEGFVSSLLLAIPEVPNEYLIINKWVNREAERQYLAKPREEELRMEARGLTTQLATRELDGDVVDVFHGRRVQR